MAGYFDLPPAARKVFFQRLPMPEFFGLLTGKISAMELLGTGHTLRENLAPPQKKMPWRKNQVEGTANKNQVKLAKEEIEAFHREARFAFFERRGPQAYRYQSSLLNSWMIQFNKNKKLPFINNEAERREWLNVLEDCLKDPHSPFDHKVHCCIVINQLFSEGYPSLLKVNKYTINKKDHLKAYASALSQPYLEEIAAGFWDKFEHDEDPKISHNASLCYILLLRYLPADKQQKMKNVLLARLNFAASTPSAIHALVGMAGALEREEIDAIYKILVDVMQNRLNAAWTVTFYRDARVLEDLVPFLTPGQAADLCLRTMLFAFSEKTVLSAYYINLIRALAPTLSLISRLDNIFYLFNTLTGKIWRDSVNAAYLLVGFAPFMSQKQLTQLLETLVKTLDLSPSNIDEVTIVDYAFIPKPPAFIANMVAYTARADTAEALGVLAPSLSEDEQKIVAQALYPKLKDPEESVRKSAADTLVKFFLVLSAPQQKHLIEFFTPSLYQGTQSTASLCFYLENSQLKQIREDCERNSLMENDYIAYTILRIREINQTPAPVAKPIRFTGIASSSSSAMDPGQLIWLDNFKKKLRAEYDQAVVDFTSFKSNLNMEDPQITEEFKTRLQSYQNLIVALDHEIEVNPRNAEEPLKQFKENVAELKKKYRLNPVFI